MLKLAGLFLLVSMPTFAAVTANIDIKSADGADAPRYCVMLDYRVADKPSGSFKDAAKYFDKDVAAFRKAMRSCYSK